GGQLVGVGEADRHHAAPIRNSGDERAGEWSSLGGRNPEPVGDIAREAVLEVDGVQAVQGGAAAAAGPGHGAAAAVPDRADHEVVAVAQGRDAAVAPPVAITHLVAVGASGGADEAVGSGNDAAGPRGAVAPGDGAPVVIPVGTIHDIVAVA